MRGLPKDQEDRLLASSILSGNSRGKCLSCTYLKPHLESRTNRTDFDGGLGLGISKSSWVPALGVPAGYTKTHLLEKFVGPDVHL